MEKQNRSPRRSKRQASAKHVTTNAVGAQSSESEMQTSLDLANSISTLTVKETDERNDSFVEHSHEVGESDAKKSAPLDGDHQSSASETDEKRNENKVDKSTAELLERQQREIDEWKNRYHNLER